MRHPVRLPLLLLLLVALLAAWRGWHYFAQRADPPPPTADEALTGQVLDADGPVAGARVRFQAECTFTDHQGRFRLKQPPGGQGGRVSASKDGYALATLPLGRPPYSLTLTALPAVDNDDYVWIDPTPDPDRPNNCGNCHAQIYRDWAASAHGRAAAGKFRAIFKAKLWEQRPEAAGVCAACHAPTFRDSTLHYDLRDPPGHAALGVHCDYCHKIADAPADKVGTKFGRDGLPLLRPPNGQQLFFGPLDDAHRAGESFAYAPFYKESRYCASCHEGVLFGQHAYGTYSEWLRSPARQRGQQCQSCHTAPTGTLTNIAPGKGGSERDPLSLSSHRLPGGQADQLRHCLSLEATRESAADGVRVVVEVRADNVGHRVPTGFIDRHLLLVVEALDAAGQPLGLLKGEVLSQKAGPALSGKPGWLYAKVLRDKDGKAPAPFWLADEEGADTRLTPGQPDRRTFTFAAGVERVRVRLLYRRFWQATAAEFGWADNEIVVVERMIK